MKIREMARKPLKNMGWRMSVKLIFWGKSAKNKFWKRLQLSEVLVSAKCVPSKQGTCPCWLESTYLVRQASQKITRVMCVFGMHIP